MLRASLIGVTLLGLAAPAAAQRQRDLSEIQLRQRIATMEVVLEQAVLNGAENTVRHISQQVGEPPMLSGRVQVRGHRLEGFGVFFDVGVPVLRMSLLSIVRQMATPSVTSAAPLTELREVATQLAPRERELAERVEQIVRMLESQSESNPRPRAATLAASTGTPLVAPPQAVPPPVAPADGMDDPGEAYTREVKAALIEAMLESSGRIQLAPDEWLVVAARENAPRDPLIPSDYGDSATVQLRVLGSDLAAFREGRITFEEAQRRVIVREQ